MDDRKELLLALLKAAALARGEARLYRRGKLPGLFPQRTRLHAEAATQAVEDGLLESVRMEPAGPTGVEWVRITPKGLDFLLASESPARALLAVREALALNEQALPAWLGQMQKQLDDLSRLLTHEVAAVRQRLDQLSRQVAHAIERLDEKPAAPNLAPWASAALEQLERRQQVGLGPRCTLAELFTTLRSQHADLSIKDFHSGLKLMRDAALVRLLPGVNGADTPGPEYALLDGPAIYYYVERTAPPVL